MFNPRRAIDLTIVRLSIGINSFITHNTTTNVRNKVDKSLFDIFDDGDADTYGDILSFVNNNLKIEINL